MTNGFLKNKSVRHFFFGLLFLQIFLSGYVHATLVRVVFLRWYYPQTQSLIFLDPKRRLGFSHLAIEVGDGWIHAYPGRGVEKITWKDLLRYGEDPVVLQKEIADESGLHGQKILALLGKSYDSHFQWDDDAYYCSELAAIEFGITPEPMEFSGEYWRLYSQGGHPDLPRGGPGVSPDLIYESLEKQGFEISSPDPGRNCRDVL